MEAQAAGRPVIAYRAGGAIETVVDGVTGVFFDAQTPESLIAAVERREAMTFDPATIRAHARTFDAAVFRQRLEAYVERVGSRQSAVGRTAPRRSASSAPSLADCRLPTADCRLTKG